MRRCAACPGGRLGCAPRLAWHPRQARSRGFASCEQAQECGDTLKGALLVLGSAISYAVYLSRSGEVVHEIGTLRTTGWATSIACVLCIAQFLLLRPVQAALLPAPVLWLSLLNATACTFVPVLCVMAAIQRVGAPLAAQAGMVGPMSTLLLGAWLLGEPLGGTVLAGTALVLAGVALLARATPPAGLSR